MLSKKPCNRIFSIYTNCAEILKNIPPRIFLNINLRIIMMRIIFLIIDCPIYLKTKTAWKYFHTVYMAG